MIVRFGAVVAFDPTTDLTFEVALRLAEIGETDSGVIKAVEESEIFHERLAQPMSFFRRKIQTERRISAKDDAVNRFHQIKRDAQDGLVVAEEEDLRRRGVERVELGEDTKFAAHVVS